MMARYPARRLMALSLMYEGDHEWYFDCDNHYIDVARDVNGKYSVYFRNRTDQSEAWYDQAAGEQNGT